MIEAADVERLARAANRLHYKVDDLNAQSGTKDRYCQVCSAIGYSSVEGVIHSEMCPLLEMRLALVPFKDSLL